MLFPGRLSDSQAITKIVFHFQVMCLISLLSGFCGTTQLDFITRHGQSETNQVLPTLLPIPFVISNTAVYGLLISSSLDKQHI